MDLSDLTPVLTAEGPFVTVHVGAESAVEQAADRYDLAWKNVLKELEARDVPEPVREAVHGARGDHSDGASRLVVASLSSGTVLLSAAVSTPPTTDTVEVGPLPRLLPLIADVRSRVPHVVVITDRTGADLAAYYDTGKVANELTVKGTTLHINKVQVGGWAHNRYQHRSENAWKQNGQEIADAARALAEQIDAELIVATGDEREVDLVRAALPTPWQEKYVAVPGGRGEGGEDFVEQRVHDTVALHVARETLDLLAEFAQERGQTKRACDGVEDVVAALRKAQVQTLLLATDADASRTLFFGDDPAVLGTSRDEVTALGADRVQEGPALDVLVRAAAATGADVMVVPHEPKQAPNGGVGAILRYADDDNAAARA